MTGRCYNINDGQMIPKVCIALIDLVAVSKHRLVSHQYFQQTPTIPKFFSQKSMIREIWTSKFYSASVPHISIYGCLSVCLTISNFILYQILANQ